MNGSLLSDLEVARLERPAESDVDHVRRLARETVRELELVAPVDPALVASFRGITRIEEVDQPWAGCLTHEGNETVARIRARDNPRRKRFTTFHEVEHTYLPGFAVTQYRCDPAPATNRREKVSLERLADIGASELLFPHAQFRADLAGNRLDFDLVEDLADVYEGSLGATALRAVTTSPRESLLICVEPAVKPTEPDADAVPRILWSAGNGDWPFVPRHKSIPADTPIHRAIQGELVDEVCDLSGITVPPIHHVDVSCRLYPTLTTTALTAPASCASRRATRRDNDVPAKPEASSRSARNARSNSKQQPQGHTAPGEPSEFGKRLRSYRDDRGLSLSALADETSLSKGYLSSLETQPQARRPSAEVLYALAQALGVTMSDLMGRKLLAAAAPSVPPSLAEYAEEDNLTEADVAMLASIQFRGEQPKTAARWRYIYQSIRGSTQLDD